jgi:hypothetical protein
MSLDVYLMRTQPTEVYEANITHNLNKMAVEAGIYECLWRPDDIGITKAEQLIEPLTKGLALLKSDPRRFEAFNSPNGWGNVRAFRAVRGKVSERLQGISRRRGAGISINRDSGGQCDGLQGDSEVHFLCRGGCHTRGEGNRGQGNRKPSSC